MIFSRSTPEVKSKKVKLDPKEGKSKRTPTFQNLGSADQSVENVDERGKNPPSSLLPSKMMKVLTGQENMAIASLTTVVSLLRSWSLWRRIEETPDRVDELERRITTLESRLIAGDVNQYPGKRPGD